MSWRLSTNSRAPLRFSVLHINVVDWSIGSRTLAIRTLSGEKEAAGLALGRNGIKTIVRYTVLCPHAARG